MYTNKVVVTSFQRDKKMQDCYFSVFSLNNSKSYRSNYMCNKNKMIDVSLN